MFRFAILLVLTVLLSCSSLEAKQINFKWTKKSMKASGMGGKRNINPGKKIMNVRWYESRKSLAFPMVYNKSYWYTGRSIDFISQKAPSLDL